MAPFSDILSFEGFKHYLVLCGTDTGLLGFGVGVTLSREPFGKFVKFGVSDVQERSFKIEFGIRGKHERHKA